ncbi:Reverse transcriptase (RNA-dependent DNA polymerase) [Phytophthora infestans]|uniref:Reverse transcriptase (RNA-dependent DNA polymerase) n=1 Tax=Phytophthora infestans TaxID=4787 RepID=A0A8S9UUC4_PHYIN|nr:Reverse transcriptase (RNA-dependent DNA polymerase) [Phytophthora infestans]
MFLTVYVDDIIIAGIPNDIEEVILQLADWFKLKDLGRVRHLLGMEVNYMPGRMVCLSQTAYIERLADKFGLQSARSVRSPQFHHEKPTKIETELTKINDPALPYKEIVGSLQYLVACTRPDLAHVVRNLGRYMSAYSIENYRAAQRVVRYALATKNMGLVYRVNSESVVMDAFCDADHQSCPETSRSVTGYLLRLHGNTWMWKSHGQRRVTEDTCSSELVACCECTKMVVWARELVLELGFSGQELQVPIHCDNQSAIAVVACNGNTSRVRHMAKHARFINEYIQAKELDLVYVQSAENLADIFTKALGPAEFERQRSRLNVEDVPSTWAKVAASAREHAVVKDVEMEEA